MMFLLEASTNSSLGYVTGNSTMIFVILSELCRPEFFSVGSDTTTALLQNFLNFVQKLSEISAL